MQGNKKTSVEFTPKVGWAECKVISANPDKEELEDLGFSPEKEPEYTDTNKDNDNQRIDFYLEEISTRYRFKKSFWLENEDVTTKPDEDSEEEAKNQFINQTGDSYYAVNKKDLPEWFSNFRKKEGSSFTILAPKKVRIAKKGEAQLMEFIKKWLNFDYFHIETNILLDLKKLFNGSFKEIKEQVGGEFAVVTRGGKEYPRTVVEMLQVKEKDVDGTIKTYQSTWKTTLPGASMKNIRNTKFSEENIAKWAREKKTKNNPDGRYLKEWEQLAVDISVGEYKSKDHYSFDLMRDYTGEKENYVASNSVISEDGDDY